MPLQCLTVQKHSRLSRRRTNALFSRSPVLLETVLILPFVRPFLVELSNCTLWFFGLSQILFFLSFWLPIMISWFFVLHPTHKQSWTCLAYIQGTIYVLFNVIADSIVSNWVWLRYALFIATKIWTSWQNDFFARANYSCSLAMVASKQNYLTVNEESWIGYLLSRNMSKPVL